jgi:hypothetical protein
LKTYRSPQAQRSRTEAAMDGGSRRQRITAEVTSWAGVAAVDGERGEYSFRYEGRELGHLHGERMAHFSFSRDLGAELHAAGRVVPHPVAPQSVKLGALWILNEDDEREAIRIMRLNYDHIVERQRARQAAASTPGAAQ